MHGPSLSFIAGIAKQLFNEIVLFALATFLMLAASRFIAPTRYNPSLYCHQYNSDEIATSDMSQFGWPLPFSGSYTIETSARTEPAGSLDPAAAIVDIGLFYLLVNGVRRFIEYLGRRSRREDNPLRLNEWTLRTTNRIIAMVILAFIVYLILHALFASFFGVGPAQAVTPK